MRKFLNSSNRKPHLVKPRDRRRNGTEWTEKCIFHVSNFGLLKASLATWMPSLTHVRDYRGCLTAYLTKNKKDDVQSPSLLTASQSHLSISKTVRHVMNTSHTYEDNAINLTIFDPWFEHNTVQYILYIILTLHCWKMLQWNLLHSYITFVSIYMFVTDKLIFNCLPILPAEALIFRPWAINYYKGVSCTSCPSTILIM